MRKAGVWAIYDADVKAAWNVLTSREDVSWRTDLKKIEYRRDKDDFVEYSNDGYQLGFIVTEERPYEYYEIETWSLETKGKRSFEFEQLEDGTTRVVMREETKIKPFFIEWLSRIFMPMEKILTTHLEDARDYIESGKAAVLGEMAKAERQKEKDKIYEHELNDEMPTEDELAVYDTDYLNAGSDRSGGTQAGVRNRNTKKK